MALLVVDLFDFLSSCFEISLLYFPVNVTCFTVESAAVYDRRLSRLSCYCDVDKLDILNHDAKALKVSVIV